VVNQFSRVAANGRCSFFGNVTLGRDVSLSELREIYHAVSFMLESNIDPHEDASFPFPVTSFSTTYISNWL